MEIDLPAYEDIYDFNEADLTFYQSKIKSCFKTNQNLSEKFQRKGQKILELIQIELEERIAVNQITSFCTKELDSDLYKEVFSDEISQVSTEIRDSEELSQAVSVSKEESVSEKVWNLRKTKKNYKDFVRNTLKNTQQGVGLVIGGSSVPVKAPPKAEEKSSNEKLKDLKTKPPPKTQDVKKPPEKKNDQKQPLKNSAKIDEKNSKKNLPCKNNEDKNIRKNDLTKEIKDKNKSASLPSSHEKGTLPKKNTKEEAKIKNNEKNLNDKEKNLKEVENPEMSRNINEKKTQLESIDSTAKNELLQEIISDEKEAFSSEIEKKQETLSNIEKFSKEPGSKEKSSNLSFPDSFQDKPQIESTERTTQPFQILNKKSSEIEKTEDLKLVIEDSLKNDYEELQPSQHPGLKPVQISLKEEKNESNFTQKSPEEQLERIKLELQDSKPGFQPLAKDIKTERAEQVFIDQSSLRKISENTENYSKPEFQVEKIKNYEKPDIFLSKPSSSESLEGLETLPQPKEPSYIRKTEPNFETYKPDETGLADLKALKQKILASKLIPRDSPSIPQNPSPESVQIVVPEAVPDQVLDPNPEIQEVPKTDQLRPQIKSKIPIKSKKPLESITDKSKKPLENITDYSSHYSSFFEIFAGCSITKDFSGLQTLRDCLTTFKEFVSLIDSPEFEVHKKFKLTLAPLEINPRDLVRGEESFPVFPCDKEMYYRVVKARPEVYDIVSRGLNKKKAWSELPHGMNLRMSWNLMWTWSKPSLDFSKLLVWQQVNHFPETKNFSRKDMLKKNIEKIAKISAKANTLWNIIPVTYILPKEYVTFVDHYGKLEETEPDTNVWIMKPVGKSRGRGISVINDVNQVSYGEVMVIQRYISNPMLLEGFKFDLRLYILITKFQPLEAFIYKEGFARISTVPFSMNPDKLHNKFIHLTNSSIQKYNHNKEESLDSILGGTKICLKTLKERLQKMGISWEKIWKQIIEVVLKSLIAVQSEIPSYSCCFDLVGYDVMIDQNLQTWLVEINSSPSLARENYLDDLIKQQLIDDTLDLINPLYFNKQELVKVLERRVAEVQKGHVNNTVSQLNQDLHRILDGKTPRKYGELPGKIGNFDMISPSGLYEKLYKIANPRS